MSAEIKVRLYCKCGDWTYIYCRGPLAASIEASFWAAHGLPGCEKVTHDEWKKRQSRKRGKLSREE